MCLASLVDNSPLESGGLSDERPLMNEKIDSVKKDSSPSSEVIDDEEVSCGPGRLTDSLAECHPELNGNFDDVDVNGIMMRAFREPLIQSGGEDAVDVGYQHWRKVAYLQGRHNNLPGGAIGRQYVDALTEEVSHVAAGNQSSDRLIVFSSLMLQRDRMIRKATDIRRVLDRRLKMWRNGEVDLLLQEAIRCDKQLKNTQKPDIDDKHIVKVFTRLMLQGKVRAAVRWLSERGRGKVLHPSELVEVKDKHGKVLQSSVWDVLCQKHPDPKIPLKSALLSCDDLPSLEDVEVTGGQVLYVARLIRGGAGPGGCDAIHWQDVLLRYGAHSERLREAVAALCRSLANSIVPWANI